MASLALNKLTDTKIRKLTEAGLYGDGGKLYLRVNSAAQKSWVFLYRDPAGKTREMGLGSLQDVSLAEARRRRQLQVDLLAAGLDPIQEREKARDAARAEAAKGAPLTLKAAGAQFLSLGHGPQSERGRINFTRSIEKHAGKMSDMLVGDIRTEHVLDALAPYWNVKVETADRLRKRVEAVLDWAKGAQHISDPWANPAAWSRLKFLLAKREHEVKHREAVPTDKAAAAMATLRDLRHRYYGGSNCTYAVEFVILTAVRNTEGRAAQWDELDREARVWTVPAARMKMKKEHRVPLSDAAVALLDNVAGGEAWPTDGYVFPSQWKVGQPVSVTSLLRVAREAAGDEAATLHGWRSTFKDWSEEIGGFSDQIGEECLAHLVGSRTRRAYRRADNLENRRPVMEAWASFLATQWAANVRPLRRTAA